MSERWLVPGLLIAAPALDGPTFRRSVVVLVQHDASGALGLVLNHPIDHPCAQVSATFGLPWPGPAEAVLRRGGPVEPRSLWMLHGDGWAFDETLKVSEGVSVSRSREALTRMCEAGEERLQLYVGYAGWGPGQLEQEIAQGAWILAQPDLDLLFEVPLDRLWHAALGQLGIDPAFLMDPADQVH